VISPQDQSQLAAVTGASRGIGRATALQLARRGYRVFGLARSEPQLLQLAADASARGLDVVPIVMDIADEESRRQAVEEIMDASAGHGLDALVNNAGYGQMGPMEEVPLEKLRQQLEVNVVGLLAFTQPFLPMMRDRRCGVIVNVSSLSGRAATPFSGAYAASKHAVEAMSDALRVELSPFGVHVVLIEPGPISTDFRDVAQNSMAADPASPYSRFIRQFEEKRKGWYLFERSPETVARVIDRAVTADHPRARYTVTIPGKVTTLTRRLVPDAVMDWALRRSLGDR
jgi:NAD(P)-dependent dehydrogenase (short-subunit alcohol dehydrogenase family)